MLTVESEITNPNHVRDPDRRTEPQKAKSEATETVPETEIAMTRDSFK